MADAAVADGSLADTEGGTTAAAEPPTAPPHRRCNSAPFGQQNGEELCESIAELLSGPKDSVTMFAGSHDGGGRSKSKWLQSLQIDMSGGGDPLDLLLASPARAGGSSSSSSSTRVSPSQASSSSSSSSCTDWRVSNSCHRDVNRTADQLHRQELAFRCRSELHKELDLFLNDAARCEAAGRRVGDHLWPRNRSQQETDSTAVLPLRTGVGDAEDGDLFCEEIPASPGGAWAWATATAEGRRTEGAEEDWSWSIHSAMPSSPKLIEASEDPSCASGDDSCSSQAPPPPPGSPPSLPAVHAELSHGVGHREEELDALRQQVKDLEFARNEASYMRDELAMELEMCQVEIFTLRQRIADSDEKAKQALDAQATICAGLDEARERQAESARLIDSARQEARQLRGEKQALQALTPAELTALAETLTESLLRVQRESQRKFEQRNDEQLCVACLSERKNVVLQPCNHLTMCENCFQQCSSVCPQCRTPVRSHLVVYM